jgi:hypothetical protein
MQMHKQATPVMTRCKSCRANIFWVEMASGKQMPLNVTPSSQGNIDVVDGVGHVVSNKQRSLFPSPLYVSHFVTCPDSKKWRRGLDAQS